MAAAITALDGVEAKLGEMRTRIEVLIARGEPVDLDRVSEALHSLAAYLNRTVARLDDRGVNLLRDSRLQLQFSELDSEDARRISLSLTLISLEKLLEYKLRGSDGTADEALALVEQLIVVVQRNTQILSSTILAMFASRDYTSEVARLVLNGQLTYATAGPQAVVPDRAGGVQRLQAVDPDQLPRTEIASAGIGPTGAPAAPSRTLKALLARIRPKGE